MTAPPAVILHLHVRPAAGKRDELLAFLRSAKPYYESPGGIHMRLFVKRDDPDSLIEVFEYETVEDYDHDEARVQSNAQMNALLVQWRSLLAEPPRVEVYRTMDV